jgi:hypothetical protein
MQLPQNVVKDTFLPFHPGAVRYYRESKARSLWIRETGVFGFWKHQCRSGLEPPQIRCAVDWRCGSAHDSGHLVGETCLAVYSFGPRYDDCAGICGASGAVVWDPPATAGSLSLNLLGCSSPVASRTG